MQSSRLLIAALFSLSLYTSFQFVYAEISAFDLPQTSVGTIVYSSSAPSLLFGGDVMLGRRVETIMNTEGETFPFLGIKDFLNSFDRTIVNLEGATPRNHTQTPDLGMRLSMPESIMTTLATVGVDIVSLANNHAYDFNEDGFETTRENAKRSGLVAVGAPDNTSHNALYVDTIKGVRVGFLMLHTLGRDITASSTLLLRELKNQSDVQIVFIHWGDEYTKNHNVFQEKLAHALVDNGADAVIGHHPHVKQDIEVYGNVPIFYSLGNLIFDQYFSNEVERGYFVSVLSESGGLRFFLYPYNTHHTRSQPRLEEGEERELSLRELLSPDYFTEAEILDGVFFIISRD